MRGWTGLTLGVAGLTLAGGLAGCAAKGTRVVTRVTEYPRVDMELEGGNRGYLLGTAPAAGERRMTREIIETDVLLPTDYAATARAVPLPDDVTAAAPEAAPEPVGVAELPAPITPEEAYDTYVVQKGDSLWTIAAKPEIYGRATAWRRLFDANRDQLEAPDQLKAGMRLRVPRGGDSGETTASDGKGAEPYVK